MKRFQRQIAVVVVVLIAITAILPLQVSAASVGDKEISARGACVLDFETGETVYGYEAAVPRVPASMTKLLAVYVIYDAIKAGEISLDTAVVISENVSKLSNNLEYSNVPLPLGISVTVRELLDMVIIWSACAATVALAERLCGSEPAFVSRMNEKVYVLDINAQFFDSFGVSAKNYISPKGMAHLARRLMIDYPQILEVSSKSSVTFRGVKYDNTNKLLGDYPGVDGLKTGYTNAALYCFTGTAKRGDCRIIVVVMGASFESRFPDTKTLFDYGFAEAHKAAAEQETTVPRVTEPDAAVPRGPAKAAEPSWASLILDGEEKPLNAFLIGGNHFFRLRDIALLLDKTRCQFDVSWISSDEGIILIETGKSYSAGGIISVDIGTEIKYGVQTPSKLVVDEIEYSFEVYLIGESNYFKLRDLETLIGFSVGWIPETHSVTIDTR